MTQAVSRAIERPGLFRWNFHRGLNKFEKSAIGRLPVEIPGFIADSITLTSSDPMIVIVHYFLEWSTVDDSLIALEARSLFAFVCLHRQAAKLNASHRSPGFFIPLEDLNSMEACIFEGL